MLWSGIDNGGFGGLGASRATFRNLQIAVAQLGQLVGDPQLRIKADGLVGPNTARAVNKALALYMPTTSGGLRKLSVARVKRQASDLINRIGAEVTLRRSGPAPGPAPAPRPGPAPAPAPRPGPAPAPATVAAPRFTG